MQTSQLNALARSAEVHPKTLLRYFAALPVRPTLKARIEGALDRAGMPRRAEPVTEASVLQ